MRSGLQTFLPLILSLVSLVLSWSGYGGWRSSWTGSGKNTLENPTIIYADLPVVNPDSNPRDAAPSSFETGSTSSRLTQVHAFFTHGTQLLPHFSTVPPKDTDSLSRDDTSKPGSTWQQVCQMVIDFYTYLSPSYPSSPCPVESKDMPVSDKTKTVLADDSHDAAAAGRVPEHAKGSCMAVVVSLVVGIMWF